MDQYQQSHPHGERQYQHGPPPITMMENSYKRKLDEDIDDGPPKKRQGRRKIKIEFIEDKSRRQITFSKRKAGIMKKAYELTTLTGTQALLLIASETGHVYTFATSKLQPFVTHHEGKALIQRCLNSPENAAGDGTAYLEGAEGQMMPEEVAEGGGNMVVPRVESTLTLVVGKKLPPNLMAASIADLKATVGAYGKENQYSVAVMAGGVADGFFDVDQSQNESVIGAEIVVVAEVDYTSEQQPAFAIEVLRQMLANGNLLPPDMWGQIASKPYINLPPESLIHKPCQLFVVSSYQRAFVNVVFGVRKVVDKGHQVVGVSCMPPDNYICCLDVDDVSHQQRLEMTNEVEGTPMYHLLPELKL